MSGRGRSTPGNRRQEEPSSSKPRDVPSSKHFDSDKPRSPERHGPSSIDTKINEQTREGQSDSQSTDNPVDEFDPLPSGQGSRDIDEDSHSFGSDEIDYDMLDDSPTDYQYVTTWGCKFNELPKAPGCFSSKLPILRDDPPNHVVFFVANARLREAKEIPRPLPSEFRDNWDDDSEVKMPCSQGSRIPDPDAENPRAGTIMRWELIEKSLKSDVMIDSFFIEDAILKYNQHYQRRWNFDALHTYFELCTDGERVTFFKRTLPLMVKLALALPRLFNRAIPFLKQRQDRKLTFSQQQVACLLANAFFCTFPRRNLRTKGGAYPDINFSSMFAGPSTEQRLAKIKCILHYFERVTTEMPAGVITYSRRVLKRSVDWANQSESLTKLHMSPHGTIEDEGRDMLQMDFANKYVGGGVLGHGCVQEEIRFLICPEMIVSRLFTEVLLDNEVLVMTGCERFSSYTGYSKTFRWSDDFIDEIGRDEWGRKHTEVVAMDALSIRKSMNQFDKIPVKRELEKAYCAFQELDRDKPAAVCTGNWGCGAFGGDPELKAVIQLIAASKAKRDVCYLSVGNKKLCRDLSRIHESCVKDKVNIGDLYQVILDFSKKQNVFTRFNRPSLLEYIAKNWSIQLF